MNEEIMRMKLTYWSGLIKEAKASGMKISEWCKMNQMTTRKYYYWHNKVMHSTYTMAVENGVIQTTEAGRPLQAALPAVPEFAELTLPDSENEFSLRRNPGITIDCGEFTINIDNEFSEGELLKVLRVMSHAE